MIKETGSRSQYTGFSYKSAYWAYTKGVIDAFESLTILIEQL